MSKTLARKGTRRSPMQAHETSPVLGASVMGMTSGVCQGQRCLPALAKGPAAPAAGWQLHRGEPKPDDEDKIPPTAVSPKVAWPRQDRQRQRMGVTPTTTRLHQLASRSLPHERIRGKRKGICLPDAGPKGEKALYKVQLSEGDRGGLEDHVKDASAGSRQPGSQPPNL
jgi:hypothetical protein